jgi:hypothetical protein
VTGVRTLIVSDLHLGSASRADVLRVPELRVALLEALREADRLVLLGDVLELRDGPSREAMSAARPFFEDLGRVLAGREVVVSAGNHDHALVAPWLARRRELDQTEDLAVEQRLPAEQASPMLAMLAQWAGPAHLTVAHPGLWVREDVYATHGHYLDCHLTTSSGERLAIAAMTRVLRRPAASLRSIDDYEAVTDPVYAWIDAVARRMSVAGSPDNAGAQFASGTADAAHAGNHAGDRRRDGDRLALRRLSPALRRHTVGLARPLVAAAFSRAGLGTLRLGLSGEQLCRAELDAIRKVAASLGLGDAYVIFGHTHRAGPLPGDDELEWRGRLGARLVNCGCWVDDTALLESLPGQSLSWSGPCVVVEDSGPPTVELLSGRCSATPEAAVDRK